MSAGPGLVAQHACNSSVQTVSLQRVSVISKNCNLVILGRIASPRKVNDGEYY